MSTYTAMAGEGARAATMTTKHILDMTGMWVGQHDTRVDGALWRALTEAAEPVTTSGWYRSRVAGSVRVEWVNGRLHVRAWASDQAAIDRYDGITPAERSAINAQNDKDAQNDL